MDACITGTFIMENFEMLKALYDFQAVYPKTISFDEGEHFVLYQTSAKQRNWWQVVSMKGAIGFVPSNYVMKIKVEPGFLLGFLESSIASLERSTDEDVNGIISRVELIERLRVKRTQASVSAKILESDSDNNGAYDSEKHYAAAAAAASTDQQQQQQQQRGRGEAEGADVHHQHADDDDAADDASESRSQQRKKSAAPAPPTKQFVPESPSMPKIEDPMTPTGAASFGVAATSQTTPTAATAPGATSTTAAVSAATHDNSIASEPSEATTTCSDDATVISQVVESSVDTVRELDADEVAATGVDNVQSPAAEIVPSITTTPTSIEVAAAATVADASNTISTTTAVVDDAAAIQPKTITGTATTPTIMTTTINTTTTTTKIAAPIITPTTPTTPINIIPEIIEPTPEPAEMLLRSRRSSNQNTTPTNGEQTLRVDAAEVYQIIDTIRQTTNLSHRLSCVALQVVLSELETIYSTRILHLLEPIAVHLTGAQPLEAPADCREHTHDAQRLKCIFAKLQACTADAEQRTWVLHEDEAYIVRLLSELVEIVRHADRTVCRAALAADQCDGVMSLVQYYQMETRWVIRELLLEAFRGLCMVDATRVVDGVLLVSVLPLELVQDMRSQVRVRCRLRDLARMLTMVWSLGGRMPTQHREHIGVDFVHFVVGIIEQSSPDADIDDGHTATAAAAADQDAHDQLADVLINMLIALNQQFEEAADNVVVQAMRDVPLAKTFTEKILVLLNRDEDPIHYFEDVPKSVPNAVLKLFVDLFATAETAALFYSNDNKVLIDILVRQLSDLSAGDALRRTYLELCRRIVRNTDYAEHQHRKPDLMKIFTRIFCEEGECSRADQQLVREIANEFAVIFKA